jgi:site-specific DNA recombinase
MSYAEERRSRVVGYARVSTKTQAENGVSLEIQESRIRTYCGLYNLDLTEVIAEDASGATLNRPGIQRVIAMLKAGEVGGLVVTKLDRLSRSPSDVADLIKKYFKNGMTLSSVTEQVDTRSANGKLFLGMIMQVAEWEREIIVERTTEALAHKRSKGERVSNQPDYGMQVAADGIHLEDCPEEQDTIRFILNAHNSGDSIRKIVALLDKRGIKSRGRGDSRKPLGVAQVHAIIKRAVKGVL